MSLPSYITSYESGKTIKSFMIRPEQRAAILGKAVWERPDLPEEWTTPEGNFKIHYTTLGDDAVNPMCTNQYDVPDWVYETGKTAEYSYRLLIDTLGFSPPPVDSKEGAEIDIYIKNWAGSYYAMTYPEDEVQGTERQYDYTSYMVIDNDYTEDNYYTHGYDALRVTVSHEFFHMIQLGYNWWEGNGLPGVNYYDGDRYFLEWCSVWFEERAWPSVNDYYNYLDSFFNNPNQSLWYTDYDYSLGFFLRYILDKYIGEENLVKVWENIKTEYAFQSLQEVLFDECNVTLSDVWNEFCQSCYYTGHRHSERLSPSPDAMDFPLLSISEEKALIFADNTTFYFRANPFSTNPLRLTFSDNKLIGINKQVEMTDNFIGRFILDKSNSGDISFKIDFNDFYIGEAQQCDTLMIFITNTTMDSTIDANLTVSEFPDSAEYQTKLLAFYPNPFIYYSNSDLKVDFQVGTHFKDLNIYFYNLLGQKVLEKTYNSAVLNFGLNSFYIPFDKIKDLPSGVYIASFELGSKRISKKFTIVK
jgi:hypothetical protein